MLVCIRWQRSLRANKVKQNKSQRRVVVVAILYLAHMRKQFKDLFGSQKMYKIK